MAVRMVCAALRSAPPSLLLIANKCLEYPWLFDTAKNLYLPSDIDDIAEERYIHAMTGRLFILSMARKAPHDSPLAIVICMCQIE